MHKEIYLYYIEDLDSALKLKAPPIQVLWGPRQVGKTTTILKLIKEKYKGKAHYKSADALSNTGTEWLNEQWKFKKDLVNR